MDIYYIQINAICLALLTLVYSRLRSKRETLSVQRLAFLNLIRFSAVLCISDIASWLCNERLFKGVYFLLEVSNITYDIAITQCCYAWLIYVSLRTDGITGTSKKRMLITAIPLMVMALVLLTNPITGFVFSIENGVYSRQSGIILHWIISWGYLIAAEMKALLKIKKQVTRYAKRKLADLLWFIVAPACAAVIQMLFYGTTAMQCGVTFSIVLITFVFLQDKMSLDTLTGLNNRAGLENYINQRLEKSNAPLTVLMCDVDGFKQINDSLGHLVGDFALKSIAGILKTACNDCINSLFLCRYGGDEFIICGDGANEKELSDFMDSVNAGIAKFNSGSENVFTLEISTGNATGTCNSYDDVEALISVADAAMYESKRARHVQRVI